MYKGKKTNHNLENLTKFEDIFNLKSPEHLSAFAHCLKYKKWPDQYYNKYLKNLNEIERKYSADTVTAKIVEKYLNIMLNADKKVKL